MSYNIYNLTLILYHSNRFTDSFLVLYVVSNV